MLYSTALWATAQQHSREPAARKMFRPSVVRFRAYGLHIRPIIPCACPAPAHLFTFPAPGSLEAHAAVPAVAHLHAPFTRVSIAPVLCFPAFSTHSHILLTACSPHSYHPACDVTSHSTIDCMRDRLSIFFSVRRTKNSQCWKGRRAQDKLSSSGRAQRLGYSSAATVSRQR